MALSFSRMHEGRFTVSHGWVVYDPDPTDYTRPLTRVTEAGPDAAQVVRALEKVRKTYGGMK